MPRLGISTRHPTPMTLPPRAPASTSRRSFLTRAIAAGGGLAILHESGLSFGRGEVAATTPQEVPFPRGKDPNNFIRHSALTFETKREVLGTSAIVPTDLVFLRNNVAPPDSAVVANADRWQLTVEGVRNPRTITLQELRRLGVDTIASVLQCSGNGRRFYQHQASGSPWGVGAAACVIWSGVPVRVVVEALGGPASGARFLTATGGEVIPAGLDPSTVVVERSVPLEKGMEDAMLAWEINGEPLPLAHGGPLRLVVPGYFGINQVKYVKTLALTSGESQSNIMRTGYRVRPIGGGGDPSQPSMWEMSVKSWINHPAAEGALRAGPVVVDGVAFGGTRAVRRVEVSIDGGRSWRNAPLIGPDLGSYAWRQFAVSVNLESGSHTLMSRATDDAGDIQPEARLENERGYGNTSWRDHAVTVTAA